MVIILKQAEDSKGEPHYREQTVVDDVIALHRNIITKDHLLYQVKMRGLGMTNFWLMLHILTHKPQGDLNEILEK